MRLRMWQRIRVWLLRRLDPHMLSGVLPRRARLWIAMERSRAGMLPFPSLQETEYENRVIGTCTHCGCSIYGGMGISWYMDETSCTRCHPITPIE